MVFIPFKKINFTDSALARFQDNVGNVLDSIANSLLLSALQNNGVNAQGITFVSGADTYVAHGLNRAPTGYFVTSKNVAVDIFTSATPSPDATKLIVLKSNANAIVNIVFF